MRAFRILVPSLLLAALSASAQASYGITYGDTNYFRPPTGVVTYDLTATITFLSGPPTGLPRITDAVRYGPPMRELGVKIAPEFDAFCATGTGTFYSGAIARFNVSPDTELGLYKDSFGNQLAQIPTLYLTDSSGTSRSFYTITINPVPEPTTFAGLGLGAFAMLRRRRKA